MIVKDAPIVFVNLSKNTSGVFQDGCQVIGIKIYERETETPWNTERWRPWK